MITVTLLGTSCMVPTKERNVSSFHLFYNGEGLLFDCGEGTQRQMSIANITRSKVKKIFISHWHGDHVSGIVGLLQTVGNNLGSGSLDLYGPVGTKARFNHLMNSVHYDCKMQVTVHEVSADTLQIICEEEKYYVQAINLDHNIPCLGYCFVERDRKRIAVSKTTSLGIPDGPLLGKLQEGKDIIFKGTKHKASDLTYLVKGKRIAVVMDTAFTKNAITVAKDADLLICEATFLDKDTERGDEYKHLTVKQAAQIASTAGVKKLVMTHFSQRYNNTRDILDEAQSVFSDSIAGHDFMKINL